MESKKDELIAKVYEAIEQMNFWKPVYLAILKETGSREEAIKALKWLYANNGPVEVENKRRAS